MPTFVTKYGSTAYDSTVLTRTASVTVSVGDVLVVWASAGQNTGAFGTPTGGTGFAWTQKYNNGSGGGANAALAVWTTTATQAQTFTLSVTWSLANNDWMMQVLQFSSATIGASASALNGGSAPSLSITTTAAGSAVAVFVADFNGVSGTSRVWRTNAGALTETFYAPDGSVITGYSGYHANAGTAGAKAVGLSAPTGQLPTIVAVELVPAGSTVTPTSLTTGAVVPSPTVTQVTQASPTSIATGNVIPSPTILAVITSSPVSITSAGTVPGPAITAVVVAAPTSIASGAVVPSVGVSLGPPTIIAAPVSIPSGSIIPAPSAAYMLQVVSPDSIATGQQVSSDTTVTGQPKIKVFIPPFIQRRVPILGSLSALMNFGLAVYRINGQWFENEHPSWQELDAADLYFPGGHINPVDAATAQILTDAGYTISEVFQL